MSEQELRELTLFFKALGDDTRLRLVTLLLGQRTERAFCVGRLAEELGVTASAVSQHLRVLKDLGLVVGERSSYRIHYRVDRDRLRVYQQRIAQALGVEIAFVNSPPRDREAPMCKGGGYCHGRSECEHPERRPARGPCSAEQIRECHGGVDARPSDGQAYEETEKQAG